MGLGKDGNSLSPQSYRSIFGTALVDSEDHSDSTETPQARSQQRLTLGDILIRFVMATSQSARLTCQDLVLISRRELFSLIRPEVLEHLADNILDEVLSTNVAELAVVLDDMAANVVESL